MRANEKRLRLIAIYAGAAGHGRRDMEVDWSMCARGHGGSVETNDIVSWWACRGVRFG